MDGEKKQSLESLVLKYQYDKLLEEDRVRLRNEFCDRVGMPHPTFYQKLSSDKFRKLEREIFEKMLSHIIININANASI